VPSRAAQYQLTQFCCADPQWTSGGQGQVITFSMTFFVTPLITASNGRFLVMAWVIRGNNEVPQSEIPHDLLALVVGIAQRFVKEIRNDT
jgi:hypothetical protein